MRTGRGSKGAAAATLLLCGCVAKSWEAGPATLVTDTQIAAALGETGEPSEPFDRKSLAQVAAPGRVRPCCAFGMDLKVQVAGVTVPGYSQGNVIGLAELGRHEYDNGAMTLNERLTSIATLESNGLVYTCRGGFIDTAHVRDNADLTLYLTNQIVAALPGGTVLSLKGDGATRRVVVKGVPPELMERTGRWETAITLAQWAAFQISIWHEIVTFYGFESFPGFSEKVSAFSPEDFYSNALGARIAGGVLRGRRIRTRDEWDESMNAWVPAALKRLGAMSSDIGRLAMKSVDGRWWDSKKELPDWTLVMRRKMEISHHVTPWRLADAKAPADDVLDTSCAAFPSALPLDIPDHLGEHPITEYVTVDFEVESWAPEALIPASSTSRRLTSEDFPRLVEAVRREAEKTLGAGFDQPGPPPATK